MICKHQTDAEARTGNEAECDRCSKRIIYTATGWRWLYEIDEAKRLKLRQLWTVHEITHGRSQMP